MRNEGYVSKKKEKQTLETISSFWWKLLDYLFKQAEKEEGLFLSQCASPIALGAEGNPLWPVPGQATFPLADVGSYVAWHQQGTTSCGAEGRTGPELRWSGGRGGEGVGTGYFKCLTGLVSLVCTGKAWPEWTLPGVQFCAALTSVQSLFCWCNEHSLPTSASREKLKQRNSFSREKSLLGHETFYMPSSAQTPLPTSLVTADRLIQ